MIPSPRRRCPGRLAVVVALLAVALAGRARADEAPAAEVRKTFRMLDEWRVEEAGQALEGLLARHASDPAVQFLKARWLFYRGDYAAAVQILDELFAHSGGGKRRPGHRGPGDLDGFHALARSTRDATQGYVQVEGEHFIIRHAPGKDEILARYALEALERARKALKEDLGYAPPGKINVEIYPTIEHLAKVSTLTLKEIQTSGTIALCKWNRLMIVSPRALLRGYPWLDTLGHEYVHLVVTRVSHNTVPIWLHEGLAKFEERRWRAPVGMELSPSSEHLLAVAVRDRKLIPFEKMHPSLAKLPSQEDTALAFAELVTVVEHLVKRVGLAGLREVLAKLRSGRSDAQAVSEVVREPFPRFIAGWKQSLSARKLRLHPGIVHDRLKFKGKGDKGGSDIASIRQERARELARLGELLWKRRKQRAALIEYEKAAQVLMQVGGLRDPGLDQRLARGHVALGNYGKAIEVASATLTRHPYHAPALVTLGEAHLARNELDRSYERFHEAIRVNPFDPTIHCGLAEIARRRGQEDERARAQHVCDKLKRGYASSEGHGAHGHGGERTATGAAR